MPYYLYHCNKPETVQKNSKKKKLIQLVHFIFFIAKCKKKLDLHFFLYNKDQNCTEKNENVSLQNQRKDIDKHM